MQSRNHLGSPCYHCTGLAATGKLRAYDTTKMFPNGQMTSRTTSKTVEWQTKACDMQMGSNRKQTLIDTVLEDVEENQKHSQT